jgi:hypothetical protein
MQDAYEEASLYCAAFNFSVDEEVCWLLGEAERITGRRATSVLEPMCGNARYGPVFADAEVRYHGFDLSANMIASGKTRDDVHISRADAGSFQIEGVPFDLGWCPINSIRHLPKHEDIVTHLKCMREHLASDGLYVLETDFVRKDGPTGDVPSPWSVPQADGSEVKAWWWIERCERASGMMLEAARFERFVDGQSVEKVESRYEMIMTNTDDWCEWAESSGFRIEQVVANSGTRKLVDFSSALDNTDPNYYLFLRPQE